MVIMTSDYKLKLGNFLPFRFTLLSNTAMNAFASAYRQHGISTPEWRTMMLLAEFPGISADRLSEMSKTEKSVVSRLITGLIKRGLVDRSIDANDRRISALKLSLEGRKVYKKVVPKAIEFEEKLRASLPPEDGAALDRILDKLYSVLQENN